MLPPTEDPIDRFEISEENLRECCIRQELAAEQVLFHIREYAEEIASTCTDAQEIAAILRERQDRMTAVTTNASQFSSPLPAFQRVERQFDLRLLLFRELGIRMLRKDPVFFADRFALTEPVSAEAVGRISYQQNHYSDRAFLLFSENGDVKTPRAYYRSHFTEVCEDVYNGVSEFGILPAGNSSEGKLLRFISLIERYELKIVASAAVSGDGGTTNEFVLVAKSADLLSKRIKGGFLQFSVVPERKETLRELFSAAEFCSLFPERLDTLPARNGASLAYYPVFRIDASDLITFYTYLSIDLPQALTIGLYQRITEKSL